jgi:hypothetical protein
MRLLTGRGGPAERLTGGRRPAHAGMGLFLIAVGAILLFAVPAGSHFGLNLHALGIILMVVGVLRLLLPATRDGSRPEGLRRLVNPTGVDDPDVHDAQSAAAADDAWIREDESHFEADGPGRQHDEL